MILRIYFTCRFFFLNYWICHKRNTRKDKLKIMSIQWIWILIELMMSIRCTTNWTMNQRNNDWRIFPIDNFLFQFNQWKLSKWRTDPTNLQRNPQLTKQLKIRFLMKFLRFVSSGCWCRDINTNERFSFVIFLKNLSSSTLEQVNDIRMIWYWHRQLNSFDWIKESILLEETFSKKNLFRFQWNTMIELQLFIDFLQIKSSLQFDRFRKRRKTLIFDDLSKIRSSKIFEQFSSVSLNKDLFRSLFEYVSFSFKWKKFIDKFLWSFSLLNK